jgi:methyltransferase (TIGR00027 family)
MKATWRPKFQIEANTMNQSQAAAEPLIRNISDTACWAAIYRARETERPDALFRDPFARRLAGKRGEQIADTIPYGNKNVWSWVTRTYLFDQFVAEQVKEGVDMVVNLAAGLDARPCRMTLPASLQWIEVDLPEILAYKEEILAGEKPVCALERVRLDLSNVNGRRELFDKLSKRAKRVLILSEGFLMYLSPDEVGALAKDLAAPASFQRWVLDMASPGLLKMLQKKIGTHLSQAGAPFKFGPPEGPDFFIPYGWKPIHVRSLFKTAARLKRLPFFLWMLSFLPEAKGPKGSNFWSGICLFAKQ